MSDKSGRIDFAFKFRRPVSSLKLSESGKKILTRKGDVLKIKCTSDAKAFPAPTLSWEFGKDEVPKTSYNSSHCGNRDKCTATSKLEIKLDHEGILVCKSKQVDSFGLELVTTTQIGIVFNRTMVNGGKNILVL